MKNILIKIASIATELDYAGLTKEAKQMDSILLKLAKTKMEKPKLEGYTNSIPTDSEIKRMDNPERVRMYFHLESYKEQLKYYLQNEKLDLKDAEFWFDKMFKEWKEKWDEEQDYFRKYYGVEQFYTEPDYIKDARNRIATRKNIIKKTEEEIDLVNAKMSKLNEHGAYDPDYEYDNGHRLKKRNIFHKMLGRDPKRDPNF